ncbi:MAG: hypothetical protein IJR65_06485 [Oscillospiraceae bacterium]|nr:hypothetical protein [Oscillospiraceae bacterium]
MNFTVQLAGVPIGVQSLFPAVHALCADYLTDAEPAFTAAVTPGDLRREQDRAAREALLEGRSPEPWPLDYLETLAVYRKIATVMPDYGAFLFHGAAVAVDGAAYLFTAPSGVGKTTHTELWLRQVPGSFIVNGDKPLLRVGDSGVEVCGTPWAGKEGRNRNCAVPLRGIALLSRGGENRIEPVRFFEAFPLLLQQSYRPDDTAALRKTLELLRRVGESVPLYRLRCNMDPEAASLAFDTMKL